MTINYNLKDNVHFLGYRTDIKELFMISDIFVMPSLREGLSRSIMEAMVCGLPCVVSKIRGNIDLIKNNSGGLLCYPFDEKSYAKAIKQLTKSKDKRIMFGNYNRKIINLFGTSSIIEQTAEIYKVTIY